jgi:hypothetical protein
MFGSLSRMGQCLLVGVLSVAVALPANLFAQDHVVSSADLRKDVQAIARSRQKSIETLDRLLASAQGQKALDTMHVSYQEVQEAVASLSDADLARLSARAQAAQNDCAAGRIGDRDLLLILIGVAVIILIIVAVR